MNFNTTSKLKENIFLDYIELLNFVNLNNEEKEMVRLWRNHRNVRNWMFTDHEISFSEHMRFIESLNSENSSHYCWLARRDKNYIGVVTLNKVDFKNKNSYFGLYTNPESDNLGECIYLFKAIIAVAFSIFGLHTLRGDTIKGNSILKIHEKFGFAVEGILKEFVYKNGEWKDVVITSLKNEKD